jgi:hypothetical protein
MTRQRTAWFLVALAAAAWILAASIARIDTLLAIRAADWLVGLALATTYGAACALLVLRARPPARVALFKLATVTLVAAAAVLVLEVPPLVGWFNYRQLWDSMTGNWRGPSSQYQLDFERGFRHIPNTHHEGRPEGDIAGQYNIPARTDRTLEFTFNSKGYRGSSTPATAEVALVGDSFVEGWYVSDGETAADWLAGIIGRSVANLGQSGYGSLQELKVIEHDAIPLHPRMLVWFFYEGNDLYDDGSFEDTMLYLRHAAGTPEEIARGMGYGRTRFRDASFTVNAFNAIRRLLDPIVPNAAPYHGTFRDAQRGPREIYFAGEAVSEWGSYEESRLNRAEEALKEGKRLCDAAHVHLLVAYVPVKFRVYHDYCEFRPGSPCRAWRLWDLPQRMQEFCRRAGMDFLDLTGPLQEAARAGRLTYGAADTHWDVAAHQIAAKQIAASYHDAMRAEAARIWQQAAQ